MINSVSIDGYRALSKFSMTGLGQINLLVGKNNAGKTSVLEALYLLATGGDSSALWRVMSRRGEQIYPDASTPRPSPQELDICHLFFGHELALGTRAKIATRNQSPERYITYEIVEAKRDENPALFAQIPPEYEGAPSTSGLAISVTGYPRPITPLVPLSSRGGFRPETFQLLNNMANNSPRPNANVPQLVYGDSLNGQELVVAFGAISLTHHEDRVIQGLRYLEPNIERIAISPMSMFAGTPGRSGFKIKLKQFEQPIPIGSMGDGIWRMLALAITLSRSKDSIILIDEIDTGLHYTVMKSMWRLIAEAAKDLNIQVFATTHSDDCVRSLSSICGEDSAVRGLVTMQRIEDGGSPSIPYTADEIKIVAKERIEAR